MNKIQAIQKGSQIIDKIFWELLKTLRSKDHLTELDLANQIKKLAKQMGAEAMAFKPIVAFGKGSCDIHHFATKAKIGKNNFLMLDYGVKISGYCSDFTRTLFLGKPTKLHENIYNLVLKAQLATLKKIKIGALGDEIDFTARHIINQSGFGKFFPHGTGHGVTKKIHDSPSFKITSCDVVAKNDVVTVEPGIYLPKKFGVRIEDMVLVTEKPRLRQGFGGQAKVFSKVPKNFQSMII